MRFTYRVFPRNDAAYLVEVQDDPIIDGSGNCIFLTEAGVAGLILSAHYWNRIELVSDDS